MWHGLSVEILAEFQLNVQPSGLVLGNLARWSDISDILGLGILSILSISYLPNGNFLKIMFLYFPPRIRRLLSGVKPSHMRRHALQEAPPHAFVNGTNSSCQPVIITDECPTWSFGWPWTEVQKWQGPSDFSDAPAFCIPIELFCILPCCSTWKGRVFVAFKVEVSTCQNIRYSVELLAVLLPKWGNTFQPWIRLNGLASERWVTGIAGKRSNPCEHGGTDWMSSGVCHVGLPTREILSNLKQI